MQLRCSTWQATVWRVAGLALLASWGLAGCSDAPPSKNAPPQPAAQKPRREPLPRAIVETWKKAGAQVGYMPLVHVIGGHGPAHRFVADEAAAAEGLPAFRFAFSPDGRLAELPAPEVPFGLDLYDTHATETALKGLDRLKSLQVLDLYNTQATDNTLKDLAAMKGLRVLDLSNTQVTDAGLKELAGLTSLETLSLRDLRFTPSSNVTDAGLKALAGLKGLRSLDLQGTEVTDAGLEALAGLTNLQWLDLSFTRVTQAGEQQLRLARPNCVVKADRIKF